MALCEDAYLSVTAAAVQLGVSPSTLWRWIKKGLLPAYRFGYRRVLLKRDDLNLLTTPVGGKKGESMLDAERQRLARPLITHEQTLAQAALAAAQELRQDLLAQRGGVRFPSSAQALDQLREERSEHLL